MKYQEILTEKNLNKEELPVRTLKKIKEIESLVEKLESEDLGDKRDDYEAMVENLDEEITKALLKFNPEVYKARLERIGAVNQKREQEPQVKKSVTPKPQSKISDINSKLDELKETVKVDAQKFVPDPEEVDAEEIKDFEKTAEVKPKKMSWAMIAMGFGALVLTYGAVNFFRERR